MSFEFYKVLHLVGILMIFSALGAMIISSLNAGSKNFANRKLLAITHGIGMTLALIAGFGLMARLSLTSGPVPLWVVGKLVIWLILGLYIMPIYRKPKLGKVWWAGLLTLGVIAICLALFKPV